MPQTGPIFVRGVSRSGGTLMVTILDAHPDVAMSYELYPDLLTTDDTSTAFLRKLIGWLRWPFVTKEVLGYLVGKDSYRVFMRRLGHSGLTKRDFIDLLREHADAGMGLGTNEHRMRFIERCCVLKMKRAGKSRWGMKSTSRFDDYVTMWPDAHVINVIRDGRDVLASQLNTGEFDHNPVRIARGWSRTMAAFEAFARRYPAQAHPVIYEKLVTDSEAVIRHLCAGLNLEFTPQLLRYYELDLTFYKAKHLSRDRVARPIDNRSVGRWRKDVTPEQLAAFYSIARDTLATYGYLDDETASNQLRA